MALKANYEFLFVGKDDNSFLENYAYDLFQDFGEKSGQIFVNLEVQNNPVDAEEIGKAVFETSRQVFFQDVEKDPYERFEVTLREVNKVLSEFKAQKFSGYIGNLNIVIAAIVGNVLFLTQSGDAEAYLIRKRYVSVVSEGLSDDNTPANEIFSSIASGSIEAGDFVMFSSTRLLRYISKNDLAKCVGKKDVVKCLEEVRELVSTEILGRVGLTGLMFDAANKEDVSEIEKEVDTATQSILESGHDAYASQKQTITGKFFTAIKSYRRNKSEVFQGGGSGRGFFANVKDWFSDFWQGLFEKGFGKDKMLALLVVVILVLAGGIYLARGNSEERQKIDELDKVLISVQDKISEAETKALYNKDDAKAILDKAYMDATRVLNSGYFRDKAGSYLLKIEETRDKLNNVKRIENPKVLVDLAAKRANVNALGLVDLKGRLFAYEYNALYEVVLNQVQDPLTIDDKETVIAATAFEDQDGIVFMTKNGKLIEYKGGIMKLMDTDDSSFRKGTAIASWSNKVYILDPTGNQIWKYSYKGTSEKFGTAESYVNGTVDLSKAQDFAIDSSVYVLQTNGDILKFYGGNKANFYINNPPLNTPKDPRVIYTNEKLDQVYVLDGRGGRVLVFDKDVKSGNLNYSTQYVIEGMGELRDIYVDPNSKKMDILTPTKILQIDLNAVSAEPGADVEVTTAPAETPKPSADSATAVSTGSSSGIFPLTPTAPASDTSGAPTE